jgi:predicted metal-dependent peptidase
MFIIIKKETGPPDPEKIEKAIARFEWLTGFMICRYKFIHTMLGMLIKEPSMGVDTMGVTVTRDGRFILLYNPQWVAELTDNELTYVFFHEVLHLALHHCTRRALTNDPAEHNLANIAHDLAVNELIPEDPTACMRPRDKDGKIIGVFVDEMKKMQQFGDIEKYQTSEWYYEYLKAKEMKGGQGGGNGFDDHDGWSLNDMADDKVTIKIQDVDQQSMWGDLSAEAKETIKAAQVHRINWRNLIRTWFGNMAWKDRIPTRKRPNRRTGMIHPGYKRSYTEKWLVVADTSGSISSDLAAEFVGVLNQLVDELPIDFAQCDADITETPHPYDRRQDKIEFKGRGGTDFEPIMQMASERHYRGLMILTDGCAAAPTRPKCRVLWVLPPHHNPPVDWGERVHLQRCS